MDMRTIVLDCARLTERQEAMGYLTEALELPEWWGRNLDALYDCLTDAGGPTQMILQNRDALGTSRFGRVLRRVLMDSAANNPCICLEQSGNGGD